MTEFNALLGKTLTRVTVTPDEIEFHCAEGQRYLMNHVQDCCENVEIEDVVGDIADLLGSPILQAEEVVSDQVNPDGVPEKSYQDSFTWTFYKLATVKGSVDIRWYGESNGCYSESVDFYEVTN